VRQKHGPPITLKVDTYRGGNLIRTENQRETPKLMLHGSRDDNGTHDRSSFSTEEESKRRTNQSARLKSEEMAGVCQIPVLDEHTSSGRKSDVGIVPDGARYVGKATGANVFSAEAGLCFAEITEFAVEIQISILARIVHPGRAAIPARRKCPACFFASGAELRWLRIR